MRKPSAIRCSPTADRDQRKAISDQQTANGAWPTANSPGGKMT